METIIIYSIQWILGLSINGYSRQRSCMWPLSCVLILQFSQAEIVNDSARVGRYTVFYITAVPHQNRLSYGAVLRSMNGWVVLHIGFRPAHTYADTINTFTNFMVAALFDELWSNTFQFIYIGLFGSLVELRKSLSVTTLTKAQPQCYNKFVW
jgi:hypothetical protein